MHIVQNSKGIKGYFFKKEKSEYYMQNNYNTKQVQTHFSEQEGVVLIRLHLMLYPPLAVNDETMKVAYKMLLSSIEINSRNTMHPRDRGSCLNSVYHVGILENLYIPVH